MKTFKRFLHEQQLGEMAGLISTRSEEESAFARRVMSRTNLIFEPGDFESVKFKNIIQKMIAYKWFGKTQPEKIKTTKTVDLKKLQAGIAQLKSITDSKSDYERLFSYKPKGSNPGPGEVVLYFLIDNAVIAGDKSKGIDLIVGNKKYEVKGARVGKHGLYGFQTGGTVGDTDIKAQFLKLKEKIKSPSDGKNSVTTTDMEKIEKQFPREYKKTVAKYQDVVHKQYFDKKEIIFFNTSAVYKSQSKDPKKLGELVIPTARGNLETIMKVKKEDIGILNIDGRGIGVKIKYKP